MNYRLKECRKCGDATSVYHVIGEFPISLEIFLHEVVLSEIFFGFQFVSTNTPYFDADNAIEVIKERETGRCCFANIKSKNTYEKIKDLLVVKCWANGGWGQITYFVTFDDRYSERMDKSNDT